MPNFDLKRCKNSIAGSKHTTNFRMPGKFLMQVEPELVCAPFMNLNSNYSDLYIGDLIGFNNNLRRDIIGN